MAIQDRAITLRGNDAKILAVSCAPKYKADGTIDKIVVTAVGVTKDSLGNDVQLSNLQVEINPGVMAPVDNLLARALVELRKSNLLET